MRYNINNHNPEEIKEIIRNFYYTSRFDKSQYIKGVCPPPIGYAQFVFLIFPKNGSVGKDGKHYDGYPDRFFRVMQYDYIINNANWFVNHGYDYIISKLKSEEDEFEILGLDNPKFYKEWTDKEVVEELNRYKELREKFFEESYK